MCSGCKGFFKKSYKARHQLVYAANTSASVMMPLVPIETSNIVESYSNDFKSLLNTLRLDEVGNYIKTDSIVLMIGSISFTALQRKKDKVVETKKLVRARMRLIARLYLVILEFYKKQSDVKIINPTNNAADLYSRESISLLGLAVN